MSTFSEIILKVKSETQDPYIVVVDGDLNGHPFEKSLEDYDDMVVVDSPPTRMTSYLNLVATSFNDEVVDALTFQPLHSDDDTAASDHKILCVSAALIHRHAFQKVRNGG